MELNSNHDPYANTTPVWMRGQFGGVVRPINRDILFKNLCEIHEIFNKYGIVHWLSHGTVLGVIREGNFIIWDDDADLSMYWSDRNSEKVEKAILELKDKGFYVPPSDPDLPVSINNSSYWDIVFIKDGEKVEFWCFEKKGNEYIYDEEVNGRSLAHPSSYYDTLDIINFKGIEFNVPNNVLKYLEMMYGSNWLSPDPNAKYNSQA